MPKAYWISAYRAINDPSRWANMESSQAPRFKRPGVVFSLALRLRSCTRRGE